MVKSQKIMVLKENHDNLVAVVRITFTNVLSHKYWTSNPRSWSRSWSTIFPYGHSWPWNHVTRVVKKGIWGHAIIKPYLGGIPLLGGKYTCHGRQGTQAQTPRDIMGSFLLPLEIQINFVHPKKKFPQFLFLCFFVQWVRQCSLVSLIYKIGLRYT